MVRPGDLRVGRGETEDGGLGEVGMPKGGVTGSEELANTAGGGWSRSTLCLGFVVASLARLTLVSPDSALRSEELLPLDVARSTGPKSKPFVLDEGERGDRPSIELVRRDTAGGDAADDDVRVGMCGRVRVGGDEGDLAET